MANRTDDEPAPHASEVVMATVTPGDETEYRNLRMALDTRAAGFPGFVGSEVFPPAAGDTNWTAVLTFESDAALGVWRASPERAELLDRIRAFTAVDHDWVLPNGFGRWSSGNVIAAPSPPAWKQAMTAVAVLYAMVSVLDITLGNIIGNGLSVQGSKVVPGLGLPLPVVVFVGNVVGTILLTWVLMPVVRRLLNWWLSPTATRAQTIRGVLLLLMVYVIELSFFVWVYRTYGF